MTEGLSSEVQTASFQAEEELAFIIGETLFAAS